MHGKFDVKLHKTFDKTDWYHPLQLKQKYHIKASIGVAKTPSINFYKHIVEEQMKVLLLFEYSQLWIYFIKFIIII